MLHYVLNNLISNIQKLETIQMSLNRGMDTKNVLHLQNGDLFTITKNWKQFRYLSTEEYIKKM